jgi:hypothetical protein
VSLASALCTSRRSCLSSDMRVTKSPVLATERPIEPELRLDDRRCFCVMSILLSSPATLLSLTRLGGTRASETHPLGKQHLSSQNPCSVPNSQHRQFGFNANACLLLSGNFPCLLCKVSIHDDPTPCAQASPLREHASRNSRHVRDDRTAKP